MNASSPCAGLDGGSSTPFSGRASYIRCLHLRIRPPTPPPSIPSVVASRCTTPSPSSPRRAVEINELAESLDGFVRALESAFARSADPNSPPPGTALASVATGSSARSSPHSPDPRTRIPHRQAPPGVCGGGDRGRWGPPRPAMVGGHQVMSHLPLQRRRRLTGSRSTLSWGTPPAASSSFSTVGGVALKLQSRVYYARAAPTASTSLATGD